MLVAAQTIGHDNSLNQNVAVVTLGSPNTLAVYDTLNSECVPQPFVQTGHPAWGDPELHPWTSGMIMSYSTEAVLWGTWIKNNLADQLPVKVAGLVMDNDFGLAYELGFEAASNPDIVAEYLLFVDPAAPTVTNEVTTIAAFDPDVFISMTAGNPCLLAIQRRSFRSSRFGFGRLHASVCAMRLHDACGNGADGWWIAGGGWKDSQGANYTDDPYMKFLNETLDLMDLIKRSASSELGFGDYGWSITRYCE